MIVSGRVCRQAIRRGFLFGPLHITLLFLLSANPGNAATWTKMLNVMPGGNTVQLMVQMTDGSILVQGYNGFTWMKLTPDATGNYINGTWSTLAQGPTPRIYFASQVLPDGRFWLVGGEYTGPGLLANWSNTGEIYDPVADSWTSIAPYPSQTNCPSIGYVSGSWTLANDSLPGSFAECRPQGGPRQSYPLPAFSINCSSIFPVLSSPP